MTWSSWFMELTPFWKFALMSAAYLGTGLVGTGLAIRAGELNPHDEDGLPVFMAVSIWPIFIIVGVVWGFIVSIVWLTTGVATGVAKIFGWKE